MDKALSDKDIMRLLRGKANIMTYQELQKYNSLDDALGPHGALVLLYTTKNNYGHWVCVFRVNKDTVEFFDSYGYSPDDQLNFIPQYFRERNYGRYPHLTALLYESGYNIVYNEYQLQDEKKGVNTCGRWCVLRILMKDVPQKKFSEYFYNLGGDADKHAVLFTNEI